MEESKKDSINLKWLSGLEKGEQRDDFKRRVLMNDDIWDKLREILKNDEDLIIKEMTKETSFSSPAWSEEQAFRLGNLKYLKSIKELIP